MTNLACIRSTVFVAGLLIAGGFAAASGTGGQARDPQGQRAGGAGQAPPAQPQGRGTQPARDTQAQQPAVGTGVISGAVLTEGSGAPVRRARVSLSGAELRGGRSTLTDNEGQFSFTSLPGGRYTMSASKPGYVDMTYGAKKPGRPGTPIQLMDGQKVEKATISLPRGSVLTGVVIDEHSEPAPGIQVRAYKFVLRTGERSLQQAGSDQTDDRGIYRIYQLQPGDYIVSAMPRNTNIGDVRERLMDEIAALTQQMQALGGARASGGGRAGDAGRGGRGAQVGGAAGLADVLGGRGQQIGERLAQVQQQLQQQEQEQASAYAPVYYPGTTSAATAATVTLGISEERGGVDFQLQLVPTARLEGTVVSPDGSVPQGTQVVLVPAQQGMPNIPGVGTTQSRANQQGRFTFQNVTPGPYTLMARAVIREVQPPAPANPQQPIDVQSGRGRGQGPGGRGGPGAISQVLWASADVIVTGENLPQIMLHLQPGMTVSGRVLFEGSSLVPPTDLTRVRVTIAPRGQQLFEVGGIPPAQVDAGGRFTIPGVAPGRYTLQATVPAAAQGGRATLSTAGTPPAQWTLQSSMANGRDVLDFPLEIRPNEDVSGVTLTFTDRSQELSGTLQDAMGRPTADFTIIVFPSDNRYWLPQARRIVSARPGTDGRFTFRNLPAGDYRLTAVTDVEPGEWYDPAFLSQLLTASIAITLTDGERKVQDLRVAGR
jgi:hypothetical protein